MMARDWSCKLKKEYRALVKRLGRNYGLEDEQVLDVLDIVDSQGANFRSALSMYECLQAQIQEFGSQAERVAVGLDPCARYQSEGDNGEEDLEGFQIRSLRGFGRRDIAMLIEKFGSKQTCAWGKGRASA